MLNATTLAGQSGLLLRFFVCLGQLCLPQNLQRPNHLGLDPFRPVPLAGVHKYSEENCRELRSRVTELRNVDEYSELGPVEEEKLLNNVAVEVETKIDWIFSEGSSNLSALPEEDLNEILGQLKKELGEIEGENADIECEIEELQRRCLEDYDKMESELEKLCCSLDFIESQRPEKATNDMQIDVSCLVEGQADFSNEHGAKFK
ncbi:UNVERIFIED_CONTAM: hypothetical protein Sindi_2412300, partial [Sesamum indicum]